MGVGPAYAIPRLLEKTGLKVEDIDIYEINEAFASQAVYCVDKLKIPKERLNPNGGAIAFGHPLGCTGSRMIATIVSELHRSKGYLFDAQFYSLFEANTVSFRCAWALVWELLL